MANSDVNIYSSFDSYIIESIFKDNYPFYSLFYTENIKWQIYEDKNVDIIATVSSRKGNILSINMNSIMDAQNYGDYKGIEYYILHEIRHLYQNEQIKKYKNKEYIDLDEDMVKNWILEKKIKHTRINPDGTINDDFYLQDKEKDAYAFAYAVMKYRYEDNFDPYIPDVYKKPFLLLVKKWIDIFKKEDL